MDLQGKISPDPFAPLHPGMRVKSTHLIYPKIPPYIFEAALYNYAVSSHLCPLMWYAIGKKNRPSFHLLIEEE